MYHKQRDERKLTMSQNRVRFCNKASNLTKGGIVHTQCGKTTEKLFELAGIPSNIIGKEIRFHARTKKELNLKEEALDDENVFIMGGIVHAFTVFPHRKYSSQLDLQTSIGMLEFTREGRWVYPGRNCSWCGGDLTIL